MARASQNKYSKQTWLYFTPHGLTLVETGMGKQALPYLKVIAAMTADNPLESPLKYIDWVKSHAPKKLNLLLSPALYQLLLSDVPDVPIEEMEGAIELKAADLLSYDIDEAVLDVIQLPTDAYRGRMRMAFIVALRKTHISVWLQELILRGIRVDIIDIEITQLRNLAVFHENFNESGLLYMTPNQSRLVMNYGKEMVLSRSFDIGLSRLIQETTVQDGELELTVAEPNQLGIQLEALVLEVRRSFDYYEAQLGLGAIAELQFLCDEQHESLVQELAQRLGVRYVMLRPPDFIDIRMAESDMDPVNYYGLTGLAYREALS